jgi:hypothetical protein
MIDVVMTLGPRAKNEAVERKEVKVLAYSLSPGVAERKWGCANGSSPYLYLPIFCTLPLVYLTSAG